MRAAGGARFPPKRSLGQNFLVDANLQRRIVAELEARPHQTVLEVGPGHGELSGHLVGNVARLILVEKDRGLASELRGRWGGREDVEIIEGDALALDLREACPDDELLILSNLPYNITTPLLFKFLGLQPTARRVVVTVQREVAERIVSPPGRKAYGALSVGVQAVAKADRRFDIGRKAFRPVPDVDSSLVVIVPDRARAERLGAGALRGVTRACFSRRRKQMQKILRSAPELGFAGDSEAFLADLGLDPRARPEALAPDDFVRLAEALQARSPTPAPPPDRSGTASH